MVENQRKCIQGYEMISRTWRSHKRPSDQQLLGSGSSFFQSHQLARDAGSLFRSTALQQFKDLVKNKIVLVRSDNTTVMSYLNKRGGGTKSPDLCRSNKATSQLVHGKECDSKIITHSKEIEHNFRQVVKRNSVTANRVVTGKLGGHIDI